MVEADAGGIFGFEDVNIVEGMWMETKVGRACGWNVIVEADHDLCQVFVLDQLRKYLYNLKEKPVYILAIRT